MYTSIDTDILKAYKMFHNLTDKIEFPTLINTLYTFQSSLYDSYP